MGPISDSIPVPCEAAPASLLAAPVEPGQNQGGRARRRARFELLRVPGAQSNLVRIKHAFLRQKIPRIGAVPLLLRFLYVRRRSSLPPQHHVELTHSTESPRRWRPRE